MARSFESVNDSLMKALECPDCLNQMEAPIHLCKNGHNICSSCKSDQSVCPTCREDFTSVRNLALEQLSEAVFLPCKNKDAGCEKMLRRDARSEHARKCPYRLYECVLAPEKPCAWRGRKTEILGHVWATHPDHFFCLVGLVVDTINYNEVSLSDSHYCNIIELDNEIYLYHKIVKADEKKLYFAVQYLGQEEKCIQFVYELKVQGLKPTPSITFQLFTNKDTDSIDAIIKSGKCVSLSWELVSWFKEAEAKFILSLKRVQ